MHPLVVFALMVGEAAVFFGIGALLLRAVVKK